MAGATRHLLNRNGRFFAQLVVPKDLRRIIGKTELRSPLGPDRRTAMKTYPVLLRPCKTSLPVPSINLLPPGLYRSSRAAILLLWIRSLHGTTPAVWHLTTSFVTTRDMPLSDDLLVANLRAAIAGKATDTELMELVGPQVEHYRYLGNHTAEKNGDEWRSVARAIAVGELEALARAAERDEGDFTGQPTHPMIANAQPPEDEPDPVSLSKLWDDYIKARTTAGFMRDGGKRMRPVTKSLRKILGHNDARKITKKDVNEWRDQLLTTHSVKTVSDMYLSAVRSLLNWAHENDRLPSNPAAPVKQAKPRKQRARPAGYTDPEAVAVLKLSRSYESNADQFGRIRETLESVSAKRWVPILCAFSGARVSEITQMRKEDIRKEGDR
ncbi:site-specific integrase [Paracoccus onubensis]|uniref:integrase n=1 Tax=Paracoccus onubensis TaxID=1675788 RepID=UPI00160496FF|nr:integrase [Paracoccus onubensis]